MSRVLDFKRVTFDPQALFDQVTISLKFLSQHITLCKIKSSALELQSNYPVCATIGAKVRVPYSCDRCELLVHMTIINMKTYPAVVEICFFDSSREMQF